MADQFERLRLPVRRWPAVDGQGLDLKELVASGELHRAALSRLMMPDDVKIFGMDLTPGAIGCALSHMQIWIDIMQRRGCREFPCKDQDAVFLVVEDDCEFLPGFSEEMFLSRLAEVPKDWQLIFLGGVDAVGFQDLLQISPGVRRVYNGSRETTGYVINVEGVRSALEVCFPLMWQLDTQLTMHGYQCDWNPEIAITTKPMSYTFWPPLVMQNKEAFPTDVQKDEHPVFLHGKDGETRYNVLLQPLSPGDWELGSAARDAGPPAELLAAIAGADRYALVGSWDDWREFHHFHSAEPEGTLLEAEIDIPPGKPTVEFQMVRNGDWDQRIFPSQKGETLIGDSESAHGHNWRLAVPGERTLLQMRWDSTGMVPIIWRFFESSEAAFSRRYALVGSWDAWSSMAHFERNPEDVGRTLLAEVEIPAGVDVMFQVICNSDWNERLFPSTTGDEVLGPSEEGHGKNWKVLGRPCPALLRVRLDPVGKRSLVCALVDLCA